MSALPSLLPDIDDSGGMTFHNSHPTDLYSYPAFASLVGDDFVFDSSGYVSGTIRTAAIDGLDLDLVSEIYITDLSVKPAGTDIFNLMKAGNYLALLQELLAKGDHIDGSSGDDTILGFKGKDFLYGNAGSDILEGGPGGDQLHGGGGTDTAQYAHAGARVVVDLLSPGNNKGDAKGDTYSSIEVITGTAYSDTISGDDNVNFIGGGSGGNNKLFGRGGDDFLVTFGGNDLLDGGRGHDNMAGGGGKDTYDFNSIKDSKPGSQRDIIQGFSSADADRIDLSTIDANTLKSGDQKFAFIGTETFNHHHNHHPGAIGMVRFENGILQANVNADLAPDLEIAVIGVGSMTTGDFIL